MWRKRASWYFKGTVIIVGFSALVVIQLTCGSLFSKEADRPTDVNFQDSNPGAASRSSRQLLSLPNCTPRAIEQFPRDFFTSDQRHHGAVLIHVTIAFYMFLGFAILCDDYFVPSLEVICEVLHIQSDVAGATFMAAGSSAPELATAVIAVFIAKDDIGVGTVVGSAVYNVLFVLSICALFAGTVVNLNWWPLFRDCLCYTVCVGALAFVMADEKIFWYEALTFIVLYMLYILLMYYNSSLGSWLVPKFTCCHNHLQIQEPESIVMYEKPVENGTAQINGSSQLISSTDGWEYGSDIELSDEDRDTDKLMEKTEKYEFMQRHEEPESVFAIPDSWWRKVLWFLSLPLKFLFFITIPDCRYQRWQRCFVVTFIMCLIWLSVLSYLMVWMITIVGYTAGVADSIMGLTFVAFGVSMPDVISSLIVVRQGLGDMAVSNAVGSNVFDILICLGIPWLIQTGIKNGRPVQVYSEGLLYATLTLLVTVLFLLIATHLNSWRLTKKYGVVLMIVYVFFTALTSMYELNVFGYLHPVECKTNYRSLE